MKTIADFEFNKAPLSEGIILVSRIIRPDFPVEQVNAQLRLLVAEARQAIQADDDIETQVSILLKLFYQDWLFSGVTGVYSLSEALWLDKVLIARKGAPVSLGTIFLHVATQLQLPVMPIIFLTQLILCVRREDGTYWYINPINGETLTEQMLDLWVKGTISPFAHLTRKDIEETAHRTIIRKMFDTIKAALMEEKKMEQALRVCETLLILDPKDPYEIRDRGLIFAHLECNHVAISDLNYFVEQCPEDPVSEMIKMQIYSIKGQQVTLH
ncbi:invasion regulator SirB1 [Arsenophonus apicola]|jgi:regulator of sirC expression with transglutaminase-like and TPR domain|uniref:invasion regulator SirB1 n=1 Tax=Arsenophonus apicola TaxID=2879119 RepID=UPI003879E6FE